MWHTDHTIGINISNSNKNYLTTTNSECCMNWQCLWCSTNVETHMIHEMWWKWNRKSKEVNVLQMEMMIRTSSYRFWRYSRFLATLVTTRRWNGETFLTRTTPAKKSHSSSSPTLSIHTVFRIKIKRSLGLCCVSF